MTEAIVTEIPIDKLTDAAAIVYAMEDVNELIELNRLVCERIKFVRRCHGTAMLKAAKPGDRVVIENVRPKFLAGLTGSLQSIARDSATILLDERSVRQVQAGGGTRYIFPIGQGKYTIRTHLGAVKLAG